MRYSLVSVQAAGLISRIVGMPSRTSFGARFPKVICATLDVMSVSARDVLVTVVSVSR